MLGTSYAVELAHHYIRAGKMKNYVLDPVMVCKGNDEALNPELNAAIEQKLLPLAAVATPNLFEAGQLSRVKDISTIDHMKEAARIIHGKGAATVFLKGGAKLPNALNAVDLFYDGKTFEILESPLIKTNWTHGAGCTTSAAIAAGLARGLPIYDAVVLAKKFITESLAGSFALNKWVGPGNPCAWRQGTLFK
jgi:pyridoxine kinase